MTLTESGRFRFCVRWLGRLRRKNFPPRGLTGAASLAAPVRPRGGKFFLRSLPSQRTQKRKRPDSVRVIGRSSNSPPPKSAQEPLYVVIAARGMARTGDSCAQSGRPGRNRTCNRRIRNPMLYPFELRAQIVYFTIVYFTKDREYRSLQAICRLANHSLFGKHPPQDYVASWRNVRYRTVSTVLLKFGFGLSLSWGFPVCLPGY